MRISGGRESSVLCSGVGAREEDEAIIVMIPIMVVTKGLCARVGARFMFVLSVFHIHIGEGMGMKARINI